MRYPEELKRRAFELYEEGLSCKKIGSELDVPSTTIRRWVVPGENERSMRVSRAYKARQKKRCIDCGAKVWMTSVRCPQCASKAQRSKRVWTRERVIKAMQEWAKANNGHPPTVKDWSHASEENPSATSLSGYPSAPFKSWNEAIKAAGFEPRRSGPGPGMSKWSKEEARHLREEGLTDREIARRFGISASAIGQRIGPRAKPPVPRNRTREQRIADLRKALEGEQHGNRDRAGDHHD